MSQKIGILLSNLGSPDQPDKESLKRYLDEFLMDPYVIDIPYPMRALLVRGILLKVRPEKSAALYKEIWTNKGSPLIALTRDLHEKLVSEVDQIPIEIGMRYGNPSIDAGVKSLVDQGVTSIHVIPLYPQWAQSSFGTALKKTMDTVAKYPGVSLKTMPPFYGNRDYRDSLSESIAPHWNSGDFDHLLLSYHGLPKSHLHKSDPTGFYCEKQRDCCERANAGYQNICYKAHCYQTTQNLKTDLGLQDSQISFGFQSRFGPGWIQPFIDELFEEYPKRGIKKLLVACPSFVTDCLETLEEISMQGKKTFMESGGEVFEFVPCLNSNPKFVKTLSHWIQSSETFEDPQKWVN